MAAGKCDALFARGDSKCPRRGSSPGGGRPAKVRRRAPPARAPTSGASRALTRAPTSGVSLALTDQRRVPGASRARFPPAPLAAAPAVPFGALPPGTQASLERWGPRCYAAAFQSRRAWFDSHRREVPAFLPAGPLRLATDCGGCEAPVWALRALGVRHAHTSSSDSADAARAFIRANSKPDGPLFEDMCERAHSDVPDHDAYVCGAPCTPFSALHHGTRFFQEAAAKPFRAMINTIAAKSPPCAVIENVVGMMRVWRRVAAMLRRRLHGYRVFVARLDPSRNFGEPVRRPRIYLILVRLDVTCVKDAGSATELAQRMLRAMERPEGETKLSDRLLPDDHALVREPRAAARKAFESWQRRRRPRPGGVSPGASRASAPAPRWVLRHAAARAAAPRGSPLAACPQASEDDLFLTSARERDMWRVVSHQSGSGSGFSIDLSQCLSRCARGSDNILPTITPRGRVVLADRRRLMVPAEKLLIHGLPLHRMLRPSGLSDAALSLLGGNTMHLHCVASAMLLGLAQVNWGALAAACPRQANLDTFGSGRRAAESPIAINVALQR